MKAVVRKMSVFFRLSVVFWKTDVWGFGFGFGFLFCLGFFLLLGNLPGSAPCA